MNYIRLAGGRVLKRKTESMVAFTAEIAERAEKKLKDLEIIKLEYAFSVFSIHDLITSLRDALCVLSGLSG